MFPRFEVAGFAITVVIVFLFTSSFSPALQRLDASPFQYDHESSTHYSLDGIKALNSAENARAENVSTTEVHDPKTVNSPKDGQSTNKSLAQEGGTGPQEGFGKLTDAMNSTFGFGKVFVISMPDRSDKRDAFSLQARVSNITFEVRDGIAGADVPAKALPLNFVQDAGATGCWRAHLNVMQEMIRDNIQSALVFEDDADWDVAIKYQALQAARATRFLTSQPEEGGSLSPYGADWDLVWLGHCSTLEDDDNNRRFVVQDDPTVLPPWSRSEFSQAYMVPYQGDSDNYKDYQTRIYFKSKWGSCTAAYGISLRGAEKVVFTESMVPYNDPVDNGMGAMCREHVLNFTCISPFPTVVGISKPAGASNRGSDIRGQENEQVQERGWSERLMWSTRENLPRILTGSDEYVSTFGEEAVPRMKLEDIGSGKGRGEWLLGGLRFATEYEFEAAQEAWRAQEAEEARVGAEAAAAAEAAKVEQEGWIASEAPSDDEASKEDSGGDSAVAWQEGDQAVNAAADVWSGQEVQKQASEDGTDEQPENQFVEQPDSEVEHHMEAELSEA